jgi:hypothetical protein
MRLIGVSLGALVALTAVYWLAFKSASVGVPPGGAATLQILGLRIPYDSTTGSIFYRLFQPLYRLEDQRMSIKRFSGRIERFDDGGELTISSGTMSMLFHFDPANPGAFGSAAPGDEVTVAYKARPVPDNPFVYQYDAITISSFGKVGEP